MNATSARLRQSLLMMSGRLSRRQHSKREIVFAGITVGLLFVVVSDQILRTVYWPRRQELAAKIESTKRLLQQNQSLAREAVALQRRYEASMARAATEPATDMGDVVRTIGNAAESLVQLTSVSPTGVTGESGVMDRGLVLQFEGPVGPCAEFLRAVAQDLGGECTGLSVSVVSQPGQTVKCMATWVFPLAVDAAPRVSNRDSATSGPEVRR